MAGKGIKKQFCLSSSLLSMVILSACGGAAPSSTPTPPSAPTPTPTPTPTPAPTPTPTPAPAPPPGPTPTPGPYNTSEFRGSDGPSQHGALTAYQDGATGAGVILGVIDGGINTSSSEFAGRIHADSDDFAGSRGISDESGHGSAVASVAAGGKNGNATHGIAFDSEILVLRTDTPGSCSMDDPDDPDDGCSHNSGAIAAAINQARISGARVVNISLGGPDISRTVRNAISNAAAAGLVVVVSSGNDGETTPDGFAAGIAESGNGHVIIAGSVGAGENISSFSNQAGAQASSYLAALGERVRADDHEGTAFLWSGTSFSAPQVSGAVALLAQAFPNLTGADIVDLLFTSARDAGDAGTDAVYGRGVLDIAAAFQPQGQSSLAGTSVAVDLTAAGGQTSAAMGDSALQGQNVGAIILDGFDRAFALNLAHDLEAAVPQYKLTSALQGDRRNMSASNAGMDIAVNIGRDTAGQVGRDNLRLSEYGSRQARLLAASVVTRIAPNAKLAIGFRQGASGLTARVQGASGAAFLVAPNPGRERGFTGQARSALAVRHEFDNFGLTLSAESGDAFLPSNMSSQLQRVQNPEQQYSGFTGIGFAIDREIGFASFSVAGNWVDEEATFLGSTFSETLGAGGSQSWFVDGRAEFDLDGLLGAGMGTGWRSGMRWRQGWTKADKSNLVTGGLVKTSSFAVDVSKTGIVGSADQLAFRFAQPLRVSSGGLNLNLPVGYSYQTLQTEFGQRTLNLSPQGRELVGEMAYATALWGGWLNTNIFWRQQPGHFENIGDDVGGAVRFQLKF